jgi:hypothetical protein
MRFPVVSGSQGLTRDGSQGFQLAWVSALSAFLAKLKS